MPVFRTYAGSFAGTSQVNFFKFVSGYLPLIIHEIPKAVKVALHDARDDSNGFNGRNMHTDGPECETFMILIDGKPRATIEMGYSHYDHPRRHGYLTVPSYQVLDDEPPSDIPAVLTQQVNDAFPKPDPVDKKHSTIDATWWIHVRDTCTSKATEFEGYPEDLDGIEKAYKHFINVLANNSTTTSEHDRC